MKSNNPILNFSQSNTEYYYEFDKIKSEHFLPAIEETIEEAKKEIENINKNKEKPDFFNVIEKLEFSTLEVKRVSALFSNLLQAESDNKFKDLAQEIYPLLTKFENDVMLDPDLFKKVEYVYKNEDRSKLDVEQNRFLDITYKNFIRNGALLSDSDKKILREIDEELSKLDPKFDQNLLNSTNSFEYYVEDENEIKGIPENIKEILKENAIKKGKNKGYLLNLQPPILMAILQYCQNRNLRKIINEAYSKRATSGEFSNLEIINKIVKLREKRAQILGYNTHADFVLEMRMANNPNKVMEFLEKLYKYSYKKALEEKMQLEEYAKRIDNIDSLQIYDWRYYGEKLRKELFNIDTEKLREYFKLEDVIDGLFKVANKLYNINFIEVKDIPIYHNDVKTFKVLDKDGSYLGILYMDLFPRDTKVSGAWMTEYLGQGYYRGKIIRPHVAICGNLTPSTSTSPSLLSLDDVRTLFHEFGHALHGLLSNCKYQSMSGPNVFWDFVELPSQIMENWVYEKESLNLFAKHYKTKLLINDEILNSLKESKKFLSGILNLRQLTFGFLDMAYHFNRFGETNINIIEFEYKCTDKLNIFPRIEGSCISSSFSHIFAGGYSAGYYSYKWAEVIEADAFELFKEKGIFNSEVASSFRENILSKGNSEDPMKLYIKFRGREPNEEALLKREGLI
ncbi:MAG: M3 family metallopeptidase [Spirochaetes bacterium]|nr:M3 family metallopeptidase [Spirochaetota bacterium]